jgi:hypothetical protein
MDAHGRKEDGGVVMLPVGCSTLKCHMGTRVAGPSCGVKGREPRLAHLPWYSVIESVHRQAHRQNETIENDD